MILKNPMYATAIGLIIRRHIKEIEDQQRGLNKRKVETAVKETVPTAVVAETSPAAEYKPEEVSVPVYPSTRTTSIGTKVPKKDSWIKGLLTNVKDWFEDESVNKDFE
jgi:cell division ATPase FtsA